MQAIGEAKDKAMVEEWAKVEVDKKNETVELQQNLDKKADRRGKASGNPIIKEKGKEEMTNNEVDSKGVQRTRGQQTVQDKEKARLSFS